VKWEGSLSAFPIRIFLGFVTVGTLVFPVLMNAQTPPSVTIQSSLPTGQPVGTPVLWVASLSNGGSNPLFQFSIQDPSGAWRVIRDYSPVNTFPWTTLDEGAYTIAVRVTYKNLQTPILKATIFQFVSRVTANTPVVSPTSHPLVALYSAPPCTGGVSVYFTAPGKSSLLNTPVKNCPTGKSVNFYIAGLYPNTTYQMQQLSGSNSGNLTAGPVVSFTTGIPAIPLPAVTPSGPPGPGTSTTDAVILFGSYATSAPQQPAVASDLSGAVLWYLPIDPSQGGPVLQRPVPGGTLMVMASYATPQAGIQPSQFLREVDLAGNMVRETGVWAINLQLAVLGTNHRINWVSHEALRLPNGHTLTFGSEERILTNVQGSGPVDVVGDLIIDLDSNFTVKWIWSAFDHLDATRKATLNETCTSNNLCGPLLLATQANDWTHGNSLCYVPSDGSLIASIRNQDWVIKIDYQNGSGSGNVLWRLGYGGDFTLNNAPADSWFSHQHTAEFNGTSLAIFDNGNTRYFNHGGNVKSRGQAWTLDEANRRATPIVNVNLNGFDAAVGSSRQLRNGNYMYTGSNVFLNESPRADAIEVDPSGNRVFTLTLGSYAYRAFRMSDLYSFK
jgi:arylsulfate sulfotransferase